MKNYQVSRAKLPVRPPPRILGSLDVQEQKIEQPVIDERKEQGSHSDLLEILSARRRDQVLQDMNPRL